MNVLDHIYLCQENLLPFLKNSIYNEMWLKASYRLKCQPHKMVKHTQTIRRLLTTNYLSVFGQFVGLALRELITILPKILIGKQMD